MALIWFVHQLYAFNAIIYAKPAMVPANITVLVVIRVNKGSWLEVRVGADSIINSPRIILQPVL